MTTPTFDEDGGVYAVPAVDVFVDGDDIDSTTIEDPGAPE